MECVDCGLIERRRAWTGSEICERTYKGLTAERIYAENQLHDNIRMRTIVGILLSEPER